MRETEIDNGLRYAQPTRVRLAILCLLASGAFPSLSRVQAPVVEITPVDSTITFHLKASTSTAGKFDNWDATLTFASPDESTGSL